MKEHFKNYWVTIVVWLSLDLFNDYIHGPHNWYVFLGITVLGIYARHIYTNMTKKVEA